ncbi:MAG: PrpF domain-containing protein [Noviherbaspirillum sp.]
MPRLRIPAVSKDSIDLVVRTVSMGKLHHAMTDTGAVALAVAAVIPVRLCLPFARSTAHGPSPGQS